LDWHQLQNENECFFLRIYGPGDYRWKGADLGVLVTKGRLQTEEPEAPEANLGDPAPGLVEEAADDTAPPAGLDLVSEHESDSAPQNVTDQPAPGGPAVQKARLTSRALRLIDAIRGQFAGVPVGEDFTPPINPVGVKSGG